jgi:hypothetical protein
MANLSKGRDAKLKDLLNGSLAAERGVFLMRKALLTIAVVLTIILNPLITFAQPSKMPSAIDTSNLKDGIVGVHYVNETNKKVKLLIQKEEYKYTYNIKGDGKIESFPLQMGNGEYRISILENIEGNKYRYMLTETVSAEFNDDKDVYLGSIQNINWNPEMEAIRQAGKLTEGLENDEEKIKAVYNYLVDNYKYDYDKLDKLSYDYLPDIESFNKSKIGICYDFASLFAGMLRSAGIPTKLVKGYAEGIKGYHAWNEVYINSLDEWVTIDTTNDAVIKGAGRDIQMIKEIGNYRKVNEY